MAMGLVTLRSEFPAVAVVMISANDDPLVAARADFGAAAFIPNAAASPRSRACCAP
jgi:hypothetical protein